MQYDFDVVVVGAGPAGLVVAAEVARQGHSVLLVEQKKHITQVHRSCCCNLIIEGGTHAERVYYDDGRLMFEQNGFSVPYSGSIVPLTSSIKVAPGGGTLRIQGKGDGGAVALSYEKEVLLQDLLNSVQAQQVTVRAETRAVAAANIDGGAAVTLRSSSGEQTLRCRIAVAADGVNSAIVSNLGLNKTRRKFFGRFGVVSYLMQQVACPYPDAWITFMGKGHTSGGRGQLYMCPKPFRDATEPAVYELTCGVPVIPDQQSPSPLAEIERFVKQGRFAPWFRNMRLVETRAALLNFYTPLVNPVEGNVVVVGDAAAFIETYVQGAIMYAFQAARAIVRRLAGRGELAEYADSWGRTFEYNNPDEIKQATQGFGLHVLADSDIDYLFGITDGDDIRGYVNEFSDPRTVRSAIMRHLDQIRHERPALAQQLQQFSGVSIDEALQVK